MPSISLSICILWCFYEYTRTLHVTVLVPNLLWFFFSMCPSSSGHWSRGHSGVNGQWMSTSQNTLCKKWLLYTKMRVESRILPKNPWIYDSLTVRSTQIQVTFYVTSISLKKKDFETSSERSIHSSCNLNIHFSYISHSGINFYM